ncbi:division plane positioning ATPase MipZ [Halobacterium sp. CBA1126]|uniref:division plane positioning ATPase MipZ n=1 Tax=Halobacterium TaxID=2239 RepID=UPI0012F97FB2|nr:division plane positioning ATPase MipZ [Halobacterium sp. CBA1126]MUV61447.1 ParA family protein [Halobacterium sp. CBA1126]
MQPRTAALVGVAGGAGTTRLAVETAAALARDGASAAVFDAAFATQGLAQYVDGRIDTDATDLLVDPDAEAADARHDLAPDAPGEVAAYPAFAPFARIADAKAPAAAERLDARLDDLGAAHDFVLVDTPPVAANQAVAAVTSADRNAAVLPRGDRGVDSLQRARGRLADVGTEFDLAVANRTADARPDADHAIPEHAETGVPEVPAALAGDGEFTAALVALAESLFETEVAVDLEEASLLDAARQTLS